MKRTLVALLLMIGLIFVYVPAMAGDTTKDFSLDAEDQEVVLGEAGGSVFNEQDTYGSNFQMDLYIERFEMDQSTNWNPQLDAKVETIKTININKTDTTTVDVDVDVNKDIDVDVGPPEENGQVLASESTQFVNGGSNGGEFVGIFWSPMCCTEVDIIMENVQVTLMSQTGGQYSDMGVDNAYAVGPGSIFEMRGMNQHLVQQTLEASNGAIGAQQIASQSATEVIITGGDAHTESDTINISSSSNTPLF